MKLETITILSGEHFSTKERIYFIVAEKFQNNLNSATDLQ